MGEVHLQVTSVLTPRVPMILDLSSLSGTKSKIIGRG
jgi:hypothetical protein